MSKRNALNLGLLAVVAVLGLIVWLQPGHKPPAAPPTLTALKPSEVHTIRIERQQGKTIELAKVDDQWRMKAPIDARANDWRVQSLLRVTQNHSLGANPVKGLDLAQYGLDKPAARLFLDKLEIDFGTTTPLGNRRYVRIGNTIHLIDDVAYYHLLGSYTGFVSYRLLPDPAKIERVALPGLTLVMRNGDWRPQPRPVHYSADALTQLVDAWRYASALSVEPYTPAKGKSTDTGEIRIQLAQRQKPLVFRIVARKPDLILARPDLGIEYHLPKDQAKALLTLTGAPEGEKEAPAPSKP